MKKALIGIGMLLSVCIVCGPAFAVDGVPHVPLSASSACSNYDGTTPFVALSTPYGAPATATVAGSLPIWTLTGALDNPVTSWPAPGAYDFCAAFDTTSCALGGASELFSNVPTYQALFMCATDINGPLNTDAGAPLPFTANGIPDGEFELGLLAAILNDTGNPHHAEVNAAFQANYNYFRLMVTAALANPPLKAELRDLVVALCGPYLHTGLTMILAGYATEGDPNTLAALDALIARLSWLGFTLPAGGVAPVTTGLPDILGPYGDADGDGYNNMAEYYYFHEQGAAATIAAQLDASIMPPPIIIPPLPVGGTYEEGSALELTAEVPNGMVVVGYAWSKDGVPLGINTPKLVILRLALTDAGNYVYTVTTDGGETLSSAPTHITVVPKVQLPVTGGLGLALLAGICAFGGAGTIRRRR